MIAVDTNILVYAHREESPWHAAAVRLLERLAAAPDRWAIPWPCIHEFLSTVTHRRFTPPTPLPLALEAVDAWLGAPNLALLAEDGDYWPALRKMVEAGKVTGPRVHDARIASLCKVHGVRELWTADRDFTRFPELVARNPLVGG